MSAAYSGVGMFALARSRRWIAARQYLWLHPEWWVIASSLAAWGVMFYLQAASREHSRHLHGVAPSVWSHEFAHWMAMIPAMMFPLLVSPLRIVAARSLWRRRDRAILEFLLGYLAAWALLGIGVIFAFLTSEQYLFGSQALRLGASLFAVSFAAMWQVTRWKRRAMTACDFTMAISPVGWRASLDCVGYGLAMGRRCIISCGPIMVAMALCPHNVLIAIAVTALLMAERYSSHFQYPAVPTWTAGAIVIVLGAAIL
jgi:hypothetical protein